MLHFTCAIELNLWAQKTVSMIKIFMPYQEVVMSDFMTSWNAQCLVNREAWFGQKNIVSRIKENIKSKLQSPWTTTRQNNILKKK